MFQWLSHTTSEGDPGVIPARHVSQMVCCIFAVFMLLQLMTMSFDNILSLHGENLTISIIIEHEWAFVNKCFH